MTVPSTNLFDLLTGRKLSSFLLLENTFSSSKCLDFWPILCERLCEKYSCIVVRSGLAGGPSAQLPPSVRQLCIWDFPSAIECLKEVEAATAVGTSNCPFVLFFDNMDAFIMDCPPEYELNDWARQLSSYIFTFAIRRSTASVVCSINVSKTTSGKCTWASEQVQEAFEFCATTCVRLRPGEKSNQLEAEFWHRRTADSICRSVRQPSVLAPSNKPTISAMCQVTLCLKTHALLSCSVITAKVDKGDGGGVLPSSTFNLTPSEREIKERQKVVLPYKAAANVPPNTSSSSLPENTIEYDPDAFDDIDDDDPDDDLDI